MSEFKKGQLVAVKIPGATKWELRVFERVALTDEPFCVEVIVRRPENATGYCVCMESVCPAEEVWPNIFIGWERRAREQDDRAVEMESKLAKRLKRQIRWLCRSLAERTHVALDCPQDMDCSFIEADCSRCWEEASFKAVKENDHA